MSNFCFLTIGKTYESTETVANKKYIGVGSSFVIAVNPDKKELESLYNTELANDPEYKIEQTDTRAKGIKIDFIVKTDPAINDGIETVTHVPFFLYDEPLYNKDKTKVQVIDAYGNSTYASVEDVQAKKELLDTHGRKAKIASSYRVAYRGEADLVAFLHTYLGIQDVFKYNKDTFEWYMKPDTQDCLFGLEHIKDYFSGDVSELKEALALQPKNKVKLLYGIRTTDKGQFQSVCTRGNMVLRNNSGAKGLAYLEKELTRAKTAGAFTDTEYRICPLREYVMTPTDLSSPQEQAAPVNDDPFEDDGNNLPWD